MGVEWGRSQPALEGSVWGVWVRLWGVEVEVGWVDRAALVPRFSERMGFVRAVYVGPLRVSVRGRVG